MVRASSYFVRTRLADAKEDPRLRKQLLHPEGVKNMHVLKNIMERMGYETALFEEAETDKLYKGPQTAMCVFVKKPRP